MIDTSKGSAIMKPYRSSWYQIFELVKKMTGILCDLVLLFLWIKLLAIFFPNLYVWERERERERERDGNRVRETQNSVDFPVSLLSEVRNLLGMRKSAWIQPITKWPSFNLVSIHISWNVLTSNSKQIKLLAIIVFNLICLMISKYETASQMQK